MIFWVCALSSFARQLFLEFLLRKAGEHKNRVLSEATAADSARSEDDDLIEQVTSKEGEDDGLATVSVDQQQITTASQQRSASEVDSLLLSSFYVHLTKFSYVVTCGLVIWTFGTSACALASIWDCIISVGAKLWICGR